MALYLERKTTDGETRITFDDGTLFTSLKFKNIEDAKDYLKKVGAKGNIIQRDVVEFHKGRLKKKLSKVI